jgi:hypothetical protein
LSDDGNGIFRTGESGILGGGAVARSIAGFGGTGLALTGATEGVGVTLGRNGSIRRVGLGCIDSTTGCTCFIG